MRKKLVIAMAAAAMMLAFAVPVGADAAGNTTKSNVHTVRTTRSKPVRHGGYGGMAKNIFTKRTVPKQSVGCSITESVTTPTKPELK